MGTPEEYTKIRRNERGKDAAWIKAFLGRSEFGTLATVQDDQPFLVTRNFAYDEAIHAIYMHGAQKGRTHESARSTPRVCFSASEAGRLLPAKRAMNLGTECTSTWLLSKDITTAILPWCCRKLRLYLQNCWFLILSLNCLIIRKRERLLFARSLNQFLQPSSDR